LLPLLLLSVLLHVFSVLKQSVEHEVTLWEEMAEQLRWSYRTWVHHDPSNDRLLLLLLLALRRTPPKRALSIVGVAKVGVTVLPLCIHAKSPA
jgi:hypothetical protein